MFESDSVQAYLMLILEEVQASTQLLDASNQEMQLELGIQPELKQYPKLSERQAIRVPVIRRTSYSFAV